MKLSKVATISLLSATLLINVVPLANAQQQTTDLGGVTTDLGGVTTDLGGTSTSNDNATPEAVADLANDIDSALAACGGSVCGDLQPLIDQARAMLSNQAQ